MIQRRSKIFLIFIVSISVPTIGADVQRKATQQPKQNPKNWWTKVKDRRVGQIELSKKQMTLSRAINIKIKT